MADAGSYIDSSGAPYTWGNAADVTLDAESGRCGPYTNAEMLALVEEDLSYLTGISEANIVFEIATGELGEINAANYADYFSIEDEASADGYTPLIFDHDGEILDSFLGVGGHLNTLGYTRITLVSGTEIVEGAIIIGCRCLENHPSGPCETTYPIGDVNMIVAHEAGHLLNLDHSQVNEDLAYNDATDDDDAVPLMYPLAEVASSQITPMADDIENLAQLYPTADFLSSHCKVTGMVLDSDGKELRCGDVQAETSDPSDTVSAFTGQFAKFTLLNADNDSTDPGECYQDCGHFEMYLAAGQTYTLTLKPITTEFSGGSGMGPCFNDPIDTVVQETLTTVAGADCVGGATLALGDFTTNSTGGVELGTAPADEEEDDATGGGNTTEVSLGCSLTSVRETSRQQNFGTAFLASLIYLTFILRRHTAAVSNPRHAMPTSPTRSF